jgi:cold shock protein
MKKGTGVIKFCHLKGYGFIVDDFTGEDIFYHAKNLLTPAKEKDRVSFDYGNNARGLIALNIKKI